MASINKLSIRGIRAFSPEDSEQVVEFYFPLTVIVGANGCGKTTIIESLKYAVTGGFPPGTRSGQSFVHDARSIGQSTVKANVKLRFTSRSSQSMVVVRSMEVTQKKAKSTFKQLDGVVRMLDPDSGERVSLSHKCSELDKQIPQLLGVTAPVLEHVIFCHQEDSSWPLQEGAILKKKFDEIFDSTRYTKALDVFRKTEKDMINQAKDIKADLEGLKSHKYAAEQFRREYDEQNEQINTVDEMKKDIASSLQQVKHQMDIYQDIIRQLEDKENLIESRRNEMAQEHMIIKKQKNMLEDDLTTKYSVGEIKNMLRDYDDQVLSVMEQKDKVEQQMKKLENDIDTFRKEEMALTSSIGKFAAEKDAHEHRLRERYTKMENLAVTYSVELNVTQQQQQPGLSFLSQGSMASEPGMTQQDGTGGTTILSISSQDMQAFFIALTKKEAELKENLKLHRERCQNEIDLIQTSLTDLGGKLKSVENDRSKLSDEKADLTREHNELSTQSGHTRLRKTDVEETRRKADEAAKKRDEENMNPRKQEIPNEIRLYEEQMDKLKRELEDDKLVLDTLRHSADAQNEIAVLRDQCEKDIEALEDAFREQSYTLQKYKITVPRNLGDNDDDGTQLIDAMDKVQKEAQARYDEASVRLQRASADASKTQRIVSEKKAYLTSSQRTIQSHKNKVQQLTQSVATIEKAVQDLRRFEASRGQTLDASIENPKELIQYVDERLEELEESNDTTTNMPKAVRKVIKRLKKIVTRSADESGGKGFICPCCTRPMTTEAEFKAFTKAMVELEENPALLKTDSESIENFATAKSTYVQFRKLLNNKMEDLRDHRRMVTESDDLEKEVRKLEDDVELFESTYKEQQEKENEMQSEVNEIQELLNVTRRWMDEANRVAEKRIRINQKNLDLTASVVDSSRDLRTVEREMSARTDKKDDLANKINRLNKEMTQINNAITHLSIQATNLDKLARDKEAKFASEQKANERKAELLVRLQQIGDEEKKLQEQMGPLKTKIRSKELERQRARTLGNDEERALQVQLSQFENDVQYLRNLTQQIDTYAESSKPEELERLSGAIATIVGRITDRKQRVAELQPEVESARNAVLDQERHKKNLKQNIDILESKIRMADLEKEIAKLEKERDSIEGYETVYEDYAAVKNKKEKLQEDQARLDGRFSEIAESIRSLKRKLSQQEYKNVDEEYRVATIKHTTTIIAAEDLKKYASALDQALLQFHSVKIGEINKRIRELWLLTYKGEDITNIEIVSGQEPGSRAAKSYNYRVVMTKGNVPMDMRGRCSAGQRVLASIVIRLALAETFGLNCGCIALDEPTVNLDYENKRGLAIALAQIVASRSVQRNFQLILITHDEDFVSMMKSELSSQTGFSMPEKIFQVRREQASDGKFYSKINSIDWDEVV